MKEYPRTELIAALSQKKLTKILYKHSKGHYTEIEAVNLKSLAKNSVGISDLSESMQITQLIELIELFDGQIATIEEEIFTTIKKLDSPILTIPGISEVAAATILGELGDINRFPSASKIVAFAGLDPKVRQYGKFNASTTRMSKRGSRYLRYSLVFSAWNIVRNDQTFKDYYDLKRSQGKGHYSALGHVSHKLIRVIFKILKDNIPFAA